MFRPSDLQLLMLHTAASRMDGIVLLPPETLGGQAIRIKQSVLPLLKGGLVIERPITAPGYPWRHKHRALQGLFITEDGRAIVGLPAPQPVSSELPGSRTAIPKLELVMQLLQRDRGASITELMQATGWQAHSTRSALSSLRKQGRTINLSGAASDLRYSCSLPTDLNAIGGCAPQPRGH